MALFCKSTYKANLVSLCVLKYTMWYLNFYNTKKLTEIEPAVSDAVAEEWWTSGSLCSEKVKICKKLCTNIRIFIMTI